MKANISSLPIEVSSYGRALNCYWRMPFREHCRIEVHNQGAERMTVYFQCEWLKLKTLPKDTLYFHARYRQEYPAEPFTVYTVFDGKGEGQYVGTVFSSQNTVGSWFGEADDRFYVDGEEEPSLVGTGTEDYFNDAWNLRLTSNLRVGTTICETKGEERRITAYRWHIDDAVTFKRSLKVEIERRSFIYVVDPETGKWPSYDFKYRPDHWSSVAYWYQKGVTEPLWEMPPAEDRMLPEVWIEPSRAVDQCRAAPGLRPRSASNRTCNLKRFFTMDGEGPGGWVEFPITLPEPGRYSASVFQNLSQYYGVWRVSLIDADREEDVLHPQLDFHDYLRGRIENWPENFHHGTTVETKLGERRLEAGDYWVRFECVGANPSTMDRDTGEFGAGYAIGLDGICFRQIPINDPYEWMQDYLPKEEALFAARDAEARATVDSLAEALESFRKEKGRYPQGIEALVGTRHWDGERIPLDPWGQRYRYRAPGVLHPWGFDVWTVHGDSRYPRNWVGNWRNPLVLGETLGPDVTVIEGEDIDSIRGSEGVSWESQSIGSDGDAPISGRKLLFIRFGAPGDWIEVELAGLPHGRYEATALAVTSHDYGICQWSIGGQALGDAFDGQSPTIRVRRLQIESIRVTGEPTVLRLECAGRSELSPDYLAGIDAILLKRVD